MAGMRVATSQGTIHVSLHAQFRTMERFGLGDRSAVKAFLTRELAEAEVLWTVSNLRGLQELWRGPSARLVVLRRPTGSRVMVTTW
jgi:hypothetical protein